METLLKPGFEKIFAIFYANKKSRIHLRDIARRTKLNENSASRFLNQLERIGILRAEKEGNLKKYGLQKNDESFLILTYFDMRRFMHLPSIRRNAISYFLEQLKEKPLIALLFGSTAKNTFQEHSDIDLLLVVNKKIDTAEAERYVDAQTATRVNCVQITYPSFINELKLKQDALIQSALATGFPVHNHVFYYERYYNASV